MSDEQYEENKRIAKTFSDIVKEWRVKGEETIIGQINPIWIYDNIEKGWYILDEEKGFVFWNIKYIGRGEKRIPSYAVLEKIAVRRGVEGKGHGQYLLDAMLEKLENDGYDLDYIELKVMQNNESAIGFYKKNGFTIEGVYEQIEKSGTLLKMYIMRKSLITNTFDDLC
jgi:GNAT superfamily N-acetyltransferase